MIVDIWVLGKRLDLYADINIKHTIQVNDISELKDRQASFTNSLPIPKTANNIQIFDGLGISSDTSIIPYQKPSCQIKIDGFDLIVKGLINITETDDEYKIHIYSGIINFFKAIENKTFGTNEEEGELNLKEINHVKNLETVVNSFSNPNYRYLITDYNGKTHYGDSNIINIDYLAPSVNVNYLFQKIHQKYGFNFIGSVFQTEHFKNLWITYPKGIIDDDFTEVFNSSGEVYVESVPAETNPPGTGGQLGNSFTITETKQHKIVLNYTIDYNGDQQFVPVYVRIYKNGILIKEYPNFKGSFIKEDFFDFVTKDVITVRWRYGINGFPKVRVKWDNTYFIYDPIIYSFSDELKDFLITDLIKEIVNIFGLTIFPSEFSNNLEYLTLHERLETAEIIDWSDKYISRNSENYVFENYAQKNDFQYQYNDKESTYNNGIIKINNVNLSDNKTAFQSKTYSPEKFKTQFLFGSSPLEVDVFKLYEKEVDENDGVTKIKYKGLDKRFHFIREKQLNGSINIGSEINNVSQTITQFPIGEFKDLSFSKIITDNYFDFEKILNDSRIHLIELNCNKVDLIHLDLKKIYYFKQEQQYYFLNKFNFDNNKTIGEFVRVKFYDN